MLLTISRRVGSDCSAAAQRDRPEIGQGLDLALRILHGQHVVVAGLRIDPEAGRDHLIGGQRGDDVVDHFALVEAQLAGAHAVDIELQRRIVDVLRNEDVRHARNACESCADSSSAVA